MGNNVDHAMGDVNGADNASHDDSANEPFQRVA